MRLCICIVPQVLALHLQRSLWTSTGHVKIAGRISFPLLLNLFPFTCSALSGFSELAKGYAPVQAPDALNGGWKRGLGSSSATTPAEKEWNENNTSGQAEEAKEEYTSSSATGAPKPQDVLLYRLRAAVVHSGLGNSGHYQLYFVESTLTLSSHGKGHQQWERLKFGLIYLTRV